MWVTIPEQVHDVMLPLPSKPIASNLRFPRYLGSIHESMDSPTSRHSAQSV